MGVLKDISVFFMAEFRPILSQSRGVLGPKNFLGPPLWRGGAPPLSDPLAPLGSLRWLFPPILFTPGIMSDIRRSIYVLYLLGHVVVLLSNSMLISASVAKGKIMISASKFLRIC